MPHLVRLAGVDVLELNFHVHDEIWALPRLLRLLPAKELREHVERVVKASAALSSLRVVLQAIVAILVVDPAFLLVGQDLIGCIIRKDG